MMLNKLSVTPAVRRVNLFRLHTDDILELIAREKELHTEITLTEASMYRLYHRGYKSNYTLMIIRCFIFQLESSLRHVDSTANGSVRFDVAVDDYATLQSQLKTNRELILSFLDYYSPILNGMTLSPRPIKEHPRKTQPDETNPLLIALAVMAILVVIAGIAVA